MTINSNNFINKVNTLIANTNLVATDIDKAIAAFSIANTTNNIVSVSSTSNLPDASKNEGRLVYVTNLSKYYYSDGGGWISDFTPKEIKYQNSLVAFGDNSCFQLGDGTTTDKCSPISISTSISSWCQVSAGKYHNLALNKNSTLWAWGLNRCGQLGDGTTTNKSNLTTVVGGFTDWCQVSAGTEHSAGIRTNGTLWTWGCATNGILGTNSTVSRSSPTCIASAFADWCQVSAGGTHTLALRTIGTIYSWGCNSCGQLGDNTRTNRSSPVAVVGGITDWCQVSAGRFHSAAIRIENGALYTWGCNFFGELGIGITGAGNFRCSPVPVVGGFTDWCQVAAGNFSTIAIRRNGTLWAWGYNGNGLLGEGTVSPRCSPVSVVGGFTDWCQVAIGESHTAAIRTNGTVWAWGNNFEGEVGDGTTVNKSSPVSVVGYPYWSSVEAGGYHTVGIKEQISR